MTTTERYITSIDDNLVTFEKKPVYPVDIYFNGQEEGDQEGYCTVYNMLNNDSKGVIAEVINNQLNKQSSKKVLKPGKFITKNYDQYIPEIEPTESPWVGPTTSFETPEFEFTPIDRGTGNPVNDSVKDDDMFDNILNKYIKGETLPSDCSVEILDTNNQWVKGTNIKNDYVGCYGYAIGSSPEEAQKQILKNKTGCAGDFVKHSLKIRIGIIPKQVYFKTKEKVIIKNTRLVNNQLVSPRKCKDFPSPGKYKRD